MWEGKLTLKILITTYNRENHRQRLNFESPSVQATVGSLSSKYIILQSTIPNGSENIVFEKKQKKGVLER